MHTFLKYLSAALLWFLGILVVSGLVSFLRLPNALGSIASITWGFYFFLHLYPRYDSWFNRTFGIYRS